MLLREDHARPLVKMMEMEKTYRRNSHLRPTASYVMVHIGHEITPRGRYLML